MSKELWFAEMERLMCEGGSYESASNRAYDSMRDRLFDHADNLRKRAKEEGTAEHLTGPTAREAQPTESPNDPS